LPPVEKAFALIAGPAPLEKNYFEYLETVALAKEALILFMDSFFLQFFVRGYGIRIEEIDGSIDAVNDLVDGPKNPRPKRMIASFNDYYLNVYSELPEVGYGGGSRFVLRTAFCSTLPQLFEAFREEGKPVITNYSEVCKLADEFMEKLRPICQVENEESGAMLEE
jgi:hypothetical protein